MADFIHINFRDFSCSVPTKSTEREGEPELEMVKGWWRAGGEWEVMVIFKMEAKAEAKTEKG